MVRTSSTTANSAGVATLDFGFPPGDKKWLLERYTIACSTSALNPITKVYDGDVDDINLIDYTNIPVDVSDNKVPGEITSGSKLQIVTTGLQSGDKVKARIQYKEVSV